MFYRPSSDPSASPYSQTAQRRHACFFYPGVSLDSWFGADYFFFRRKMFLLKDKSSTPNSSLEPALDTSHWATWCALRNHWYTTVRNPVTMTTPDPWTCRNQAFRSECLFHHPRYRDVDLLSALVSWRLTMHLNPGVSLPCLPFLYTSLFAARNCYGQFPHRMGSTGGMFPSLSWWFCFGFWTEWLKKQTTRCQNEKNSFTRILFTSCCFVWNETTCLWIFLIFFPSHCCSM